MAKKQRWAYWKFLQVENWFLSYFSYWTLSSHLLHFRTEYFFRFGINLDFHLMQIVDVENVSRLFFFFKLSPFSTWEITIVFDIFTASIGDLMVANWVYWWRVSRASKRIFATIKSPIDVVKLSNTIQLSPF